jgi:putative tryptophan/tyrosine transport system substrate-binding protein
MRRREFICLVGGVTAWPVTGRAQQPKRLRRVGVLFSGSKKNKLTVAGFTNTLHELGWMDGKNIHIDYRWVEANVARLEPSAKELINLHPDVILAETTPVVAAVQRETKTIPIVFVAVGDPVGSGFVESLAHPGGNTTGFANFEPASSAKYIEILKEIDPGMTAVWDMFNPDYNNARLTLIHPFLEAAARHHAVELIAAPVRSDADIERVIIGLGDKPTTTSCLIVAGEPFLILRNDLITSLAISYRIPAVYSFRTSVAAGGLISYGNNLTEQVRQAAGYVDRILKGENPADLPVQLPTKYEMIINLKTAKVMGLTVPPTLLARADEVIE